METVELKRCPFCGGEAEIHKRLETYSETCNKKKDIPEGAKYIRKIERADGSSYCEFRRYVFIARCKDTECIGRIARPYKSENNATEAWNRRTDDERNNE